MVTNIIYSNSRKCLDCHSYSLAIIYKAKYTKLHIFCRILSKLHIFFRFWSKLYIFCCLGMCDLALACGVQTTLKYIYIYIVVWWCTGGRASRDVQRSRGALDDALTKLQGNEDGNIDRQFVKNLIVRWKIAHTKKEKLHTFFSSNLGVSRK